MGGGLVLKDLKRCKWAGGSVEMSAFHDDEWGVPPASDQTYFEFLSLEIFEAGLNWTLIFNKRDSFRSAFDNFDVPTVAKYSDSDVERIMAHPGIIRNRRKVVATIENAQMAYQLQSRHGSLGDWLEGLDGDEVALIAQVRKLFKFAGPSVARCFLHDVGRTTAPHDDDCWKAFC